MLRCLLTKFYSRRIMMIGDDSHSVSIVSILNISCDVSRYKIHELRSILIRITILYRSLCLPVFPAFCVSAVARALPWCCLGFSNTRVSPDVLSPKSLSKVFNLETGELEGIPCPEWYSVLLGSTQLSLVGVDQVLALFLCCRPCWKPGILAARTWTSLVV